MSQKRYKFVKSKYNTSSKQIGYFKKLPFLFPVFFALIIIGYVGLTNHVSSRAFVLRDLEAKAEELRNENEQLELRAHELGASILVEERLLNLPLVKLNTIEYLSRRVSQVVRR